MKPGLTLGFILAIGLAVGLIGVTIGDVSVCGLGSVASLMTGFGGLVGLNPPPPYDGAGGGMCCDSYRVLL